MKASEVGNRMVVDREGTVWLHCGTAVVDGGYWRYVADPFGELSYDLFDELPTGYEPYTALDGAASSLIHRAIKAPAIKYATEKA